VGVRKPETEGSVPVSRADPSPGRIRHAWAKLRAASSPQFGSGAVFLSETRARAARIVSGLTIAVNATALGLGLLGLGKGLPLNVVLLLALVGNVLLHAAVRKTPLWGGRALTWFWAASMPFLIEEPYVSERTAVAFLLPPALAMVLAGRKTVVAAALLQLPILVLRAPTPLASPYLGPTFLVMSAMVVGLLLVAQHLLLGALHEAARTAAGFELISRETTDVVLIRRPTGVEGESEVLFMSPAVAKITGYPPGEVERGDVNIYDLVHPEDLPRLAASREELLAERGASRSVDIRVKHKEGHWLWFQARGTNLLHEPYVGGVVTTLQDITEAREARMCFERELAHQAEHDPLTALPNRRVLQRDLETAFAARSSIAVLFCDLDGFKIVNDSLGHDVGDRLLRSVTARVSAVVDGRGMLYRFGGDEFVVLCPDAAPDTRPVDLAREIMDSLRRPLDLEGREVFVNASIGVAFGAGHEKPDTLIRDADVAMYRAKESGRDRIEVFDDDMRRAARRRHDVEQALRRAVAAEELSVVYQPRFHASTRLVLGFEALVRWTDADLGPVSPTEFVPIAEETGLIIAIGLWVLERAAEQLRVFRARFPGKALSMSVNLSARQLLGEVKISEAVRDVLRRTSIPPASLELEITEGIFVSRAETVVEVLSSLRALGVRLSVDDFGTGYSSLAYLRRFPIDAMKIDRTFITDMVTHRDDATIVRVVIELARALGIRTTAEGVENEDQARMLTELGCDELQGFHLARPMTAEAAEDLLQRATTLHAVAEKTAAGA
jgi:diguanylate cyclase (GGDEF)-like protein/PAS domain S-box-containing protein